MQTKDIGWINTVRALCMISVYLLHSEFYYGNGGFSYGYVLTPFYVNAFFFVSGYLFFQKHLTPDGTLSFSMGKYRQTIRHILFRLILPTLLFSTLIYIPKMMFHHHALSVRQYLYDVWGGVSYWFTSALTVAQLLLATLLLSLRLRMSLCLRVCLPIAIAGIGLGHIDQSPFPWNYQKGMEATLLMCAGGMYRRHESRANRILSCPITLGAAVLIYLSGVWLSHPAGPQVELPPTAWHLWTLIVNVCGIISVTALSHVIPRNGWTEYIGKDSIIFYFFSGVMPAFFGTVAHGIFHHEHYSVTLAVTVVSLLTASAVNFTIRHYFPYLADLRKMPRGTQRNGPEKNNSPH